MEKGSAFCAYRAHLSGQGLSPLDEINRGQHGKGPVRVLHQAAIADLGKIPQALQSEKGMLDLGTQTHWRPATARLRVMRFEQGIQCRSRHQPFHLCQKVRLSRWTLMLLEARRQCHLALGFASRVRFGLSDILTINSFTSGGTCSVFP